jgi:hypothetical protein
MKEFGHRAALHKKAFWPLDWIGEKVRFDRQCRSKRASSAEDQYLMRFLVLPTPEALGALQKAEIEKWWPIIKAAGIKPE